MKNTKKLIAVLVALVMVVACVFALAACDTHKCESKCETCGKCTNKDCTESACKDKCEGHGSSSDEIPTEEGKVTLYWNVVNTVELSNITSYFLCGAPNSWTQGNTDYELKRLGTTNTYYVFMDPTVATDAEYKVLIGYNSNSPVDTAAQGPFWANESYGSKTWGPGGPNSKVPEFTGNTVDCGIIEFEGCLGDPVAVTNFDVKVSFVKGVLTDDSVVYIMGHFSSWANTPNDPAIKAVKDTDPDNNANLDVYKIHVDSMYAKEKAEYLIIVFPNGLGDEITKESGTVEVWDYYNRANSGGIKIAANGGKDNATIAVDDLSTDNYLEIGNTISTGSTARGLDLSKKVENTSTDPDTEEVTNLGNYNLGIETVLPEVQVTFTVTFTESLAEDLVVYIAGQGFDGLAWNEGTIKMTATDATRKTFTVTVTVRQETSFEYKVVVGSATALDWDHSYGDGDGNAQGKITEAGNYELFEDALVYTA